MVGDSIDTHVIQEESNGWGVVSQRIPVGAQLVSLLSATRGSQHAQLSAPQQVLIPENESLA